MEGLWTTWNLVITRFARPCRQAGRQSQSSRRHWAGGKAPRGVKDPHRKDGRRAFLGVCGRGRGRRCSGGRHVQRGDGWRRGYLVIIPWPPFRQGCEDGVLVLQGRTLPARTAATTLRCEAQFTARQYCLHHPAATRTCMSASPSTASQQSYTHAFHCMHGADKK